MNNFPCRDTMKKNEVCGMEFVFKPEKLTNELTEQIANAIGLRAENASRKKPMRKNIKNALKS